MLFTVKFWAEWFFFFFFSWLFLPIATRRDTQSKHNTASKDLADFSFFLLFSRYSTVRFCLLVVDGIVMSITTYFTRNLSSGFLWAAIRLCNVTCVLRRVLDPQKHPTLRAKLPSSILPATIIAKLNSLPPYAELYSTLNKVCPYIYIYHWHLTAKEHLNRLSQVQIIPPYTQRSIQE